MSARIHFFSSFHGVKLAKVAKSSKIENKKRSGKWDVINTVVMET